MKKPSGCCEMCGILGEEMRSSRYAFVTLLKKLGGSVKISMDELYDIPLTGVLYRIDDVHTGSITYSFEENKT